MKYLVFLFLLIAINNNVFCQKDSLRLNSVFIELGGVSGQLSINYDCIIPFNDKTGLNIGFGFSPGLIYIKEKYINTPEYSPVYSPRFPIQIKAYYQLKKHTFDFGGAITHFIWPATEHSAYNSNIAIFGQVGYKYSVFNVCYISIAFCPNIFDNRKFLFFPWGALRFGYKF